MKVAIVLSVFIISMTTGTAQTISSDWESKLGVILSNFKSCMEQSENTACRSTIGKSIKEIYSINDFQNSGTALEIANSIESKGNWKNLGQAYNQEVLTQAQKLANQKKPVLAVYKGEEDLAAHVVLILPGDLEPSGSWGLQVPMVASFFTHQPEKSFVDKTLAYAFSKTMLLRIELYARN